MTKPLAIEAAAKTFRELATIWGPNMQARMGLSLKGICGYDEEQLGPNPIASKVFNRNFFVNDACLLCIELK